MTATRSLRILLLSGYHAASHRYWCDGLVGHFPEHDWTTLTLSPRYFSWRIRGNPLSWLSENRAQLAAPYDLVIATSTVDLATLRGLVPRLAATPAIVYFHENQFEYPRSVRQHPGVEPQMVNLYAALAGDALLFNSRFNFTTFCAGAKRLLGQLPDHRPRSIESLVADKSRVLPVPLADDLAQVARRPAAEFTLCWNHRWEYDKAPERLLLTLRALARRGVPFRLHLLGERFRTAPPALATIQQEFGAQLGQVGFAERRADYLRLLAESHVVLSNSLHEFQGIAVLEAVALGALPRVPARLSYPELFPSACCYPSLENAEAEAEGLAERLADDYRAFRGGILPAAPAVTDYGWGALKPRYAEVLERVAARRAGDPLGH